jgi:SPP1 gp7 family putative phage head morphogenesis protein
VSWSVTAAVTEFDEAVTWFRSKTPVTQEQLDQLEDVARARAFTLAGAMEIEAVQTVFDELDKSLAAGTPFEEFQKAVEEKLLDKMGPAGYHLETVFINNCQQAYNSGRWVQQNDPAINALRPFRMYDSVVDDHTTPHCRAWDGVIRAWDDPCWQFHSPQCHHRCRACLRSLRPKDAARRGLTEQLPEDQASDGFGLPPDKRNDGVLRPKVDNFDPEVWKVFESREFQAQFELEMEKERAREARKKRDADKQDG